MTTTQTSTTHPPPQLPPHVLAQLERAVAALRLGMSDEAQTALAEIPVEFQHKRDVLKARISAAIAIGNKAEAGELIKTFFSDFGSDVFGFKLALTEAIAAKDSANAMRFLQVLKLKTGGGARDAEVIFLEALTLCTIGAPDKAKDAFRRLLNSGSSDVSMFKTVALGTPEMRPVWPLIQYGGGK